LLNIELLIGEKESGIGIDSVDSLVKEIL